ncbi:hypothetical protein NG701_12990 [Pseudarthrobacter sp. HLT3-5]|uniref:hypothetical protein n=1 Tax=Pseudarthrobacter cellobiosi TaxID=2953654 RepID=UPI00208F965F|nr:hypothetical protein [Pseudarthrobacter sp. HLT3-5]MCO4275337.1 hypothetical protein [Pseudarthrobacter sp. HLT3-5]
MGRQGNSSPRKTASAPGSRGGSGATRQPSAAVYRRRRLFVGTALLMAVALTFGGFAVAGAFSGTEQASSTDGASESAPGPSPSDTAGSEPTPSPTPSCNQNLVTVSASTDKAAYGPDENPLLTLKVTNGGTMPCEVNIGTSQMEFLVTSGADRIFSSKDCQAKSEDLVKTIAPGTSETANFPWSRNRTLEGCSPIEAKPGAGGAYYIFTAKLGSRASPKAVFQVS